MKKIIILSLFALMACTPKEVPQKENESAKPTLPPQKSSTQTMIKSESIDVDKILKNRFLISAELNRGESLELVPQLATLVLSEEFMQSENVQSDDATTLASLFETGLLQMLQSKPEDALTQELAQRFQAFVLDNCDEAGDQCTHLGYFAHGRLPKTSDIFALLVQNMAKDLRKLPPQGECSKRAAQPWLNYYKALRLGVLSSRNRVKNQDVPLMYVEFASQYAHALKCSGSKSVALLERHNNQLSEVLIDLATQGVSGSNRKPFCDFVLQTKPYGSMASVTRNGSGRELISEFIRCASERSSLRPMITEFVRSEREAILKKRATDQSSLAAEDATFAEAQQYLLDKPYLLRGMGVSSEPLDPYAEFVLNAVYYDRADLNTALQYWRAQSGTVSDLKLIQQIKSYVQIQLLYLMQKSQSILAAELKKQMKVKEGLGPDFFADTVDSVNQQTQFQWRDSKLRVDRIKDFTVRLLDEKYGFRGEAAQAYASLKHQLDSIGQHLSYTSVAPMMLPINYYISKANGVIKILIPWWRGEGSNWFEIDGRGAISRFVDNGGNLAQLFNYGDQNYRFTPLQSLYVVDVALRSGIFDSIPFNLVETADNKNIIEENEYLFFKRYLFEALEVYRGSLTSDLKELTILEKSEEFRSFLGDVCANPLHAYATMTLSGLQGGTLQTSQLADNIIKRIYSSRRSDYLPNLREQAERLLKVFNAHFFGPGAEERLSPEKLAKRETIMNAMKEEYERFFQLERSYNRKWAQLDAMIVSKQRDCLSRIYRADWYRRYKIYDLNIEFYRNIHAAMSILKAVGEAKNISDANGQFLTQAKQAVYAAVKNPLVNTRALNILDSLEASGLWKLDSSAPPITRLEAALNQLFSIHNEGSAPFIQRDPAGRISQEVGYFVTGVGETPRVKALKRMNWFTANHFRQGKWDSLMRVRRQLQTAEVPVAEAVAAVVGKNDANDLTMSESRPGYTRLAPNLDVMINSITELENDTQYYGDTTRYDVIYNSDPEEFLRMAMIQFGGWHNANGVGGNQHLSWHAPMGGGLEGLNARTRMLADANRAPIELQEKAPCERDSLDRPIPSATCIVWKAEPDIALSYLISWSDLLNLDERDREILKYLQWPGRFDKTYEKYFRFRTELTTTKWTYFDEIYRRHYTSVIVQKSDGTSSYKEEIEGRDSFMVWLDNRRTNFKPETHLFAINEDFMGLTRNASRAKILRQLDAVKAFENAVIKLEDQAAAKPELRLPDVIIEREVGPLRQDENYVFTNYRIMFVRDRTDGPRAKTPIYLRDDSESSKDWFWSYVRSFTVKDSDCEFLPKLGDPDFKPGEKNEKAECSQRFLNWKEQAFIN